MNYKEYSNILFTKERITVFDLIELFKKLDTADQEFLKSALQNTTYLRMSSYIELMDGFLKGRKIQKRKKFTSYEDEWMDENEPTWSFSEYDYRFKEK